MEKDGRFGEGGDMEDGKETRPFSQKKRKNEKEIFDKVRWDIFAYLK